MGPGSLAISVSACYSMPQYCKLQESSLEGPEKGTRGPLRFALYVHGRVVRVSASDELILQVI
jgi:hypothetical protein